MAFTTLLDVESLRRMLPDSGRVVILDCRFDLSDPAAGRRAYEAAHIPGAHYADLNRDLAAPVTAGSGRHPLPDAADLRDFFGSLGVGADTQVVAYDAANGAFAARAWWLLRWLGHTPVAVLDGGFQAWVASGGALQDGRTPPRTGTARLATRPAAEAVMDTAGVVAAVRDPQRLLIDARAAERFAGSVEPVDPVAGHVPGAVNHPFAANLDAEGRFLPPAELRRLWLRRLAGAAPDKVILMCGSGVTACHNRLALELAGLPGAHLYAGSWSEWIRDASRPVARG